jgi:hypothetical protein
VLAREARIWEYKEESQMRITQVFKSSIDGQEISETEIGGSQQAMSVPRAMRRDSRVRK